MKKNIIAYILLLILASCNGQEKKSTTTSNTEKKTVDNSVNFLDFFLRFFINISKSTFFS